MPRIATVLLIDDNATCFLQRRALGRLAEVGSFWEALFVPEGLARLQELQVFQASEESVLVLLDAYLELAPVLLRQREWLNRFPRDLLVCTCLGDVALPAGVAGIEPPLVVEALRPLLQARYR